MAKYTAVADISELRGMVVPAGADIVVTGTLNNDIQAAAMAVSSAAGQGLSSGGAITSTSGGSAAPPWVKSTRCSSQLPIQQQPGLMQLKDEMSERLRQVMTLPPLPSPGYYDEVSKLISDALKRGQAWGQVSYDDLPTLNRRCVNKQTVGERSLWLQQPRRNKGLKLLA